MTDWEWFMAEWERGKTRRVLIIARCVRCHRFAARYSELDGWERGVKCQCDPPPVLPQGDELALLIARATVNGAITIRV